MSWHPRLRLLCTVPMSENPENTAAAAINAELAVGHPPLSVEECKVRYGAALDALVSLFRKQAQGKA